MKIRKDCVLENYETVKKFEQKLAEHLRDFEIEPSDDFVCQYTYIYSCIYIVVYS